MMGRMEGRKIVFLTTAKELKEATPATTVTAKKTSESQSFKHAIIIRSTTY